MLLVTDTDTLKPDTGEDTWRACCVITVSEEEDNSRLFRERKR